MPGGGGSSKTVSTQELSDEQKQMLGMAMPFIEEYASKPIQQYPHSVIPAQNATQAAGNKALVQAGTGTVNPLIKDSTKGIGGVLANLQRQQGTTGTFTDGSLMKPNANPYLKGYAEAVTRPITRNLTRNILPSIASGFGGKGQQGSTRQGIAEGLAISDANQQTQDAVTKIYSDSYGQGLGATLSMLGKNTDAFTSALGQVPGIGNLAFTPGMITGAVGDKLAAYQGAKNQEAKENFINKQMLPILQGQDIAQLAFGMGGGTATTTGSQSQGFDAAGTALGIGQLGLLGAALGLFSDRRLKKNIEFKEIRNGINWYTFEYITNPGIKYQGVMADEVEEIIPEAVVTGPLGYKLVNYNMILGV